MSSDGSVSSRLRQLGLYRSIDARTEEFLRLSRRRQIKQGCFCAAISTAVTVTVVICVVVMYEYIIISESSRHKQSWRNLMNSSADMMPFQTEYDLTNIDLSIKLLTKLLKTLSQNRFIEEIISDSENVGESYKENIFLDVRNWIKDPAKPDSSKQFKSPLGMYFKSPMRKYIDASSKNKEKNYYKNIIKYTDEKIQTIPHEDKTPMTINREKASNYFNILKKVEEYSVKYKITTKSEEIL